MKSNTKKLPKNRQDLIDMYLKSLEENTIPWSKLWETSTPKNACTGFEYKGINNLYLSLIASKNKYKDNRWITYKQMKKKKWKFISDAKGKGVSVEFWCMKHLPSNKIYNFNEYHKLIDEKPELEQEFRICRRNYCVFNGDLVDGLVNTKEEVKNDIISNDYIENIINNIGVKYKETGEEAYYNPKKDEVVIPSSNKFESNNSYYATQLHELSHASGHESRLNRNIMNTFGTEEYAKEELRAEISSSFLMQKFHLEEDKKHLDNHKSYIQNWIKILKNNPNELFKAIADADKIVDYLEEKGMDKELKKNQNNDKEMEMDM